MATTQHRHNASRTDRLRRIARPLSPVQAPFYVQHPTRATPLIGWWWTPAGHEAPVALGHSYEAALLSLAHKLPQETDAA